MAFIPISRDENSQGDKDLLTQIFSREMIKMIFYHCCRVDIEDNNDKAVLLQELLGPEFIELGTGTNRMAFLYNPNDDREFKGGAGLVMKIALDRRGQVDNFTEFKRSQEAPEYFVKAYETNMLILIEEYVTLMDRSEFEINANGIKTVLDDLSKIYIFEDIGFSLKNYANWGYRSDGTIVILDLGYVYPMKGNEEVMSCPKCRAQLRYNQNYTGFICDNSQCRTKYTFLDIRRRMNLSLENYEDQMIADLNNVEMPDLDNINAAITGIGESTLMRYRVDHPHEDIYISNDEIPDTEDEPVDVIEDDTKEIDGHYDDETDFGFNQDDIIKKNLERLLNGEDEL